MALALVAGGISNAQQLGFFSSFTHHFSDSAPARAGGSFDFETESEVESAVYAAPVPTYEPLGNSIEFHVTHYGESFNGQVLGCGTGYYTSENTAIVAVGPARSSEWPCGTPLQVCGPAGCIQAFRHDACPGCTAYVIDLSEAGIDTVCGSGASVCKASVTKMRVIHPPQAPLEYVP